MTTKLTRRVTSLLSLTVAFSVSACARTPTRDNAVGSLPPAKAASPVAKTVFTDSAMFRQLCTEADSGITLHAGRCTPRDQSLKLRKP